MCYSPPCAAAAAADLLLWGNGLAIPLPDVATLIAREAPGGVRGLCAQQMGRMSNSRETDRGSLRRVDAGGAGKAKANDDRHTCGGVMCKEREM